jgi:hypothetical protein
MIDIETMERLEREQRDKLHAQVVVPNKEKSFHVENTKKLNTAKDIFKKSSGLDNISQFDMKKFREIMLG